MKLGKVALAALLTFSLAAITPVSAEHHGGEAEAEAPSPDGYVWFSRKGLGLILGGSSGGGRIHFRGDDHTFRMTGVKVGALIGPTEMKMSGEVYGLTRLEDFAGDYKQTTAGISAIVGGGGVWLENDKGVKMNLKAEGKGVGLDITVGQVNVKLGMVD